MVVSSDFVDYYKVLQCVRTASLDEMKKCYQRLILSTHPDKQEESAARSEEFSLVHKAWSVLRDPESRKLYDAALTCEEHSEMLLYDTISLKDMEVDPDTSVYSYSCRCGGTYLLDMSETMSQEVVIGCEECSFSIQVKL